MAGALVGGLGSTAWLAQRVLPVQQAAFVGANVVMIVLGLALVLGAGRLAPLERLGAAAWLLSNGMDSSRRREDKVSANPGL